MSGIVSSTPDVAAVRIVVRSEQYNIESSDFYDWDVKDEQFAEWTEKVLEAFHVLEQAVNNNVRNNRQQGLPLENSVTLDPALCAEQLKVLAYYGILAYRGIFKGEARKLLEECLKWVAPAVASPTFIYNRLPFPWEVLYDDESYEHPDPEMFWGTHYAPARIIDKRHFTKYAREQDANSRMLFCLHQRLRETHQKELPQIELLVKARAEDCVHLLGALDAPVQINDFKSLLAYLDKGEHNMIHFACHAKQRDAGNDALLVSLITAADMVNLGDQGFAAPEIVLDTNAFTLAEGIFSRQPLVFLNACQSAGGGDTLRDAYNLPRKFIERGAAALIATACPVPDIFAAEFARIFYGYFLRGRDMLADQPEQTAIGPLTIAEALRLTRRYFIKKHNNPLGLAYGLYSPNHYRVAQPPAAGGVS